MGVRGLGAPVRTRKIRIINFMAGRKSDWLYGPTVVIRVPEWVAAELLELAHLKEVVRFKKELAATRRDFEIWKLSTGAKTQPPKKASPKKPVGFKLRP